MKIKENFICDGYFARLWVHDSRGSVLNAETAKDMPLISTDTFISKDNNYMLETDGDTLLLSGNKPEYICKTREFNNLKEVMKFINNKNN